MVGGAETGEREELLERNSERDQCRRAVGQARAGHSASLLVEGSAGIGKTAVLAVFSQIGHDSDFSVFEARGSELAASSAFGVVRQLFAAVDPATALSQGREAIGQIARKTLSTVLGTEAEGVPQVDPSTALLGLTELAEQLAAARPLMLAIDDVQWADVSSVRWLSHLAEHVRDARIVLAVGYRPGEPEGPAPIRNLIDALPLDGYLRLTALSAESSSEVVRRALGAGADNEFLLACHETTAGNPFLLHELVGELRDRAIEPREGERERVLRLVPERVARRVRARVARLPEGAQDLARSVAVLGDGAALHHAANLAGLDLDSAAALADGLAQAEIFASGVPLGFVHPIVRGAVYDGVGPVTAKRMHATAARLLADSETPQETVAAQLIQAPPAGDVWAAGQLRATAAAAVQRGSPDAAVKLLGRALSEQAPQPPRMELLLELARAELSAGGPASEHFEQALASTGDAVARAAITLELAVALIHANKFDQAAKVCEQAREALPEQAAELALLLDGTFIGAGWQYPPVREAALARAAGLLPTLKGDTPLERAVLATLAMGEISFHERVASSVELATRALASGALTRELGSESPALWYCTIAYVLCERFDHAAAAIGEAREEAITRGSVPGLGLAAAFGGLMHHRMGMLLQADTDTSDSLGLISGASIWISFLLSNRVDVLVDRGFPEAAQQLLDQYAPPEPWPKIFGWDSLRYTRARMNAALGRPADALNELLELGARMDIGGVKPTTLPWRSAAGEVARTLGQPSLASELAETELEIERKSGLPRALGNALRAAANVRGPRDGLHLMHEAVEVLQASDSKVEYARALIDLAALLLATGANKQALEPLRQGADLAQRQAADGLTRRAHRMLLDAGARPRRLQMTGAQALTPAERRVCDLAAQGLGNQAIAQTLTVSKKTVEMHLRNSFRKLDVSSRRDLTRALADQNAADTPEA